MTGRLLGGLTAGVLLLAGAPATAAQVAAVDRTTAEVADLAEAAAAGDAAALAALEATTSIEGEAADLAAALATPDPADRSARLGALSAVLATDPAPEGVAQVVEDVLAQPSFQSIEESWWDRLVRRLSRWFRSLVGSVVDTLGGLWSGLLALVLVAALAGMSAYRWGRRRAATVTARVTLDRLLEEGVDPDDLERRAAAAAAAGDWETAVRSRFVAGLLRLDQQGRIRFTPGLTDGDVAARLGLAAFDRCAARFDRVVYGRRAATRTDWADSEADWAQILGGVPAGQEAG